MLKLWTDQVSSLSNALIVRPTAPIEATEEYTCVQRRALSLSAGACWGLLSAICRRNGGVYESKHVVYLLTAYSATVDVRDRTILRLLHLYEDKGCSLAEYK